MKTLHRSLATALCITLSGTFFAGASAAQAYAVPSNNLSHSLAYEDPEVSMLLDQMATEFEAQYQADPVAFDQAITGLNRSFSSQTRLGMVSPNASWESYAQCVGHNMKQAVNKPVIDALKSRQWRVASSIIHTNLSRILGAKGASIVIKKIANKFLPGGLPGQIIWIAGKCGVKEFI